MSATISIAAFLLSGAAEIGGGYLVWLWLREGRPLWIGVLGGLVLILYGIIPTIQPASFGRVTQRTAASLFCFRSFGAGE